MLTNTALNLAVGAVGSAADTLKLHSGAPGTNGTANEISGTSTAVTYSQSAIGEQDLSAGYEIDIAAANTTVSHYTVWDGATLLVVDAFDASETYANANGKANVTSAKITVQNIV